MIDLNKIIDAMRRQMEIDKKNYLKTFTTGDRIVKQDIQYVSIIHPKIELGRKGIFIEPSGDTKAKVIFKGEKKPEIVNVMYIKLDADA